MLSTYAEAGIPRRSASILFHSLLSWSNSFELAVRHMNHSSGPFAKWPSIFNRLTIVFVSLLDTSLSIVFKVQDLSKAADCTDVENVSAIRIQVQKCKGGFQHQRFRKEIRLGTRVGGTEAKRKSF